MAREIEAGWHAVESGGRPGRVPGGRMEMPVPQRPRLSRDDGAARCGARTRACRVPTHGYACLANLFICNTDTLTIRTGSMSLPGQIHPCHGLTIWDARLTLALSLIPRVVTLSIAMRACAGLRAIDITTFLSIWADVTSMCATMRRATTGRHPGSL